jgi:hypothetical protein
MDIHIPSKGADLNEILRTDAAVREQTAGLLAKL